MKFLRSFVVDIVAGLCLLHGVVAHAAEEWPSKQPIALVVPFPAGGTTDMVARSLALTLGKLLNQTIIVDNRAGAGGTLGAYYAARAKPDGYTLFLATTAHTVAPSIYDALPYDFSKDLSPITTVASCTHVLVVDPKLPINSVADLIKYAKAHPDTINYGSAGLGATDHLSVELFSRSTDIKLKHVPYKGDEPMMIDLLGGRIQMAIPPSGIVMGPIRAHSIRALAVSSQKSSAYFPDIPPISETAGLSDYTFKTWYALMVPAGTPPDVQTKLYKATLTAIKSPDMQQAMQTIGADPGGEPSEELAHLIAEQTQKWRSILKPGG